MFSALAMNAVDDGIMLKVKIEALSNKVAK